MGRYHAFRYNTGVKYGVSDGNTNLLWAIEIDWNGDSIFDGTNEALQTVDLVVRRGRKNLLSESGLSREPVEVGVATITLDNSDRRYDPRNSSSSLYPNVLPGRLVRIRVKDGTDGTFYSIFSGHITDIQPVGGRFPKAIITVEDGVRWLRDRSLELATIQTSHVDQILSTILSSISWPSIWGSSIELAADTIPFWWADPAKSVWEMINDLVEGSFGQVFIAADGKIKYYSRQHTASVVATLTSSLLLKEISFPQPWETIRNVQSVFWNPVVSLKEQDIWTLQTPIYVGGNSGVTIYTKYSAPENVVAAINVISPQATTDYLANTQADELGTDLTSNFSVTVTAYAQGAKQVIINSGSSGGYVTFLRLRGDAIISQDPVRFYNEDSSSISQYGPKRFEIDVPWLQLPDAASNLLSTVQSYLAAAKLAPKIQIESRTSTQFGLELFDRVTLNLGAVFGASKTFNLGAIEHRWLSPTGQAVLTTFSFEDPLEIFDSMWTFSTQINVSSKFAW